MPAWLFMWTLSFAIFAGLKWMTWWTARKPLMPSLGRSIAYLAAWPGMDAEAFLDSARHAQPPVARQWLWAAAKTAFGIVLMWIVGRRIPAEYDLLRGWTGLFGLIFLLHFGTFHLIALFWQAVGIDAKPIMSNPAISATLSEFWGKRWNLGFRQLAHDFIFRPLLKRTGTMVAGLFVFAASGLIHDLVISLPARGGFGLPTAYFLIQGLGVIFERSALASRIGLRGKLPARLFTLVVTAAPVFWLFHPPFVQRVILPFMRATHAL
jgi:Membrane bound O-acyl transferase family